MKVHWIDDEPDLLDICASMLDGFNVQTHASWETCKPQSGDVVIHDLIGVGVMKQPIEGVCYLSCSGDTEARPDIKKPFNIKLVIETIERHIGLESLF